MPTDVMAPWPAAEPASLAEGVPPVMAVVAAVGVTEAVCTTPSSPALPPVPPRWLLPPDLGARLGVAGGSAGTTGIAQAWSGRIESV